MKQSYDVIKELAAKLTYELGKEISMDDVGNALFILWGEEKEMEWMLDIMDEEMDFDETYDLLKDFDFAIFRNVIYTTYDVIEDVLIYQIKVLIKSAGVVWIIHRYDKDPFPSNPHAHQVENNIKLDLRNGNCYRKKKFLKKVSEKELLQIREQAALKFKGELPPLEA